MSRAVPHWDAYFSARSIRVGECILWQGSKDATGYGRVRLAFAPGINFAHRLSYFVANGPFDLSLRVCHRCDVPSCVNPEHLWLGTQRDNIDDMLRKQRQRGGRSKGEDHSQARLTNADVRQMRQLRRETAMPFKNIAELFGVSPMTAYRACKGQSWSHLEPV